MNNSNNISFAYLYQILRKEKDENGLTDLKFDLFNDISKYLKLKKELLNEFKEDKDKKEQLEEELKSIIDIIKQIYQERLRKTIALAENAIKYGNFDEKSLSNLSEFEKTYFENIVQVFSKQKKWLYDQFAFFEKEEENEIKIKKEEKKEEIKEKREENKNEKKELIKIAFTRETPKFMGLDLKFKGPYKEGDTDEFNQKQVKFLEKKGLVKRIS